jgi:hypothetical protein
MKQGPVTHLGEATNIQIEPSVCFTYRANEKPARPPSNFLRLSSIRTPGTVDKAAGRRHSGMSKLKYHEKSDACWGQGDITTTNSLSTQLLLRFNRLWCIVWRFEPISGDAYIGRGLRRIPGPQDNALKSARLQLP